jgi:hypothetical protein
MLVRMKAASAAHHGMQRLRRKTRRDLLATLRRQSRLVASGFFRREAAPELFDLGMTAKDRRGMSLRFGGIVFPLKHGWHVYVADPETGEMLVAGGLW